MTYTKATIIDYPEFQRKFDYEFDLEIDPRDEEYHKEHYVTVGANVVSFNKGEPAVLSGPADNWSAEDPCDAELELFIVRNDKQSWTLSGLGNRALEAIYTEFFKNIK